MLKKQIILLLGDLVVIIVVLFVYILVGVNFMFLELAARIFHKLSSIMETIVSMCQYIIPLWALIFILYRFSPSKSSLPIFMICGILYSMLIYIFIHVDINIILLNTVLLSLGIWGWRYKIFPFFEKRIIDVHHHVKDSWFGYAFLATVILACIFIILIEERAGKLFGDLSYLIMFAFVVYNLKRSYSDN